VRAFVRRVAWVAARVLAGWALLAGGALALTGAIGMGVVGAYRGPGPDPAFTASLTPVHTDGHAIVVPDVGAVLQRHGAARLLGDGRLTVTVESTSAASPELVAALVPAPDAVRYFTGTAHAEVLAVGYATGAQPVQSVDRPGAVPSGRAPWEPESGPSAARTVTLTVEVPPRDPVALVVRRPDGAPDLSVAITVGYAPTSWGAGIAALSVGGTVGTLAGLALLLVRRPTLTFPDDAALDDLAGVSPYVYTAT
jgi:hypothetical protein